MFRPVLIFYHSVFGNCAKAKDGKNSKHTGYVNGKNKSSKPHTKATKQGEPKLTTASKHTQNDSRKSTAKRSSKSNGHSTAVFSPLNDAELAIGKDALVKLGKEPMPVTITDIEKDGIFVQLKSGMTVRVQQAQLFSSQKVTDK